MFLLRKIWAIYAVLLFLVLMTLILPVIGLNMIMSPGPSALRRNIWFLHHIFTPVFLGLIGIRLRIEGVEHIDPARSYVIVGNHRSSLDFIVNAAAFPGVYRYLAKQELQKIPVFGWVVKKMCLIVDRSSAMSRARSVVSLKQQLAEGWSIFIYPEGSRNKTEDALGTFHDGAFRVAIQTGAPLAIQTLVNVRDVISPTSSVDLRPGILRIFWEQPIETSELKQEDVVALKERVRSLMEMRISNH